MSGLFLVAAIVLALNPARALLRLEPAVLGTSRRERTQRAATAAFLATVVGVALAATASSVLRALDISASTFRIPAGIVIALSGLAAAALPVRRWPSWGERPGRADVLAPMTVPVLVHPALAAATVTWSADRGVALPSVGVVIAGALFAVGAGRLPRLDRPLVAGAASRLAGLAAVAIGVVHGVHGVLAV